MLARWLYVISDLHLGGEAAGPGKIGFQMCPPAARRKLARFLHTARTSHPSGSAELVINGDFVDFLAVGRSDDDLPCDSFTSDSEAALDKLRRVFTTVDADAGPDEGVFDALEAWVASGHALSILLGNHDLELALPKVRTLLIDRLCTSGSGRVQFLYDGEAYSRGGVVIEHGNRYDGWNAVSHGGLRAFRAATSRGESAEFEPPPGSRLVAEVMNPLKAQYRFVDLLKPENETVVPVLAALEPDELWRVKDIARLALDVFLRRTRPGRVPRAQAFTASGEGLATPHEYMFPDADDPLGPERTQRVLAEAATLWGDSRPARSAAAISAGMDPTETRERSPFMVSRRGPAEHEARYRALQKAFMVIASTLERTFDTEVEAPQYLEAARRLAGAGARVVVFGHTHLPKRIDLDGGALYLNTGTWCPLIRLPAGIYDGSLPDVEALGILRSFVRDLAENRTESWCEQKCTVARIELSESGPVAQLLRFNDRNTLDQLESNS